MVRRRANPADVDNLLLNTATQDGKRVRIGFGKDPGQAGKSQALHLASGLWRAAWQALHRVPTSQRMAQDDTGDPAVMLAEAAQLRAEVRSLLPALAAARRAYFRERSDASREEPKAMETRAGLVQSQLNGVIQRLQDHSGLSDEF
jgi:hypothetical protein